MTQAGCVHTDFIDFPFGRAMNCCITTSYLKACQHQQTEY